MALRAHLRELRDRLLKAALAMLAGAVVGWFLYDPVLEALGRPIQDVAEAADREASLNFGTVASPFDLKIKISIFIGAIVSSPIWTYQLWAFITPGLKRRERRYALAFVAAAVPLFLAGSYLAYQAMPNFVKFLVGFSPDQFSNFIDAQVYLGFVMRVILSFGLSFLVPVVLVGMNLVGVVSGRAILKAWRWVVVASFTFAAIATPTPDILSMFLLALPLLGLFVLATGFCLVNDRRRRRAGREGDYEALDDDEASAL